MYIAATRVYIRVTRGWPRATQGCTERLGSTPKGSSRNKWLICRRAGGFPLRVAGEGWGGVFRQPLGSGSSHELAPQLAHARLLVPSSNP
jgi:hypothetical protein